MPATRDGDAILDGELRQPGHAPPNKPEIWIHNLEVAVENLASTRPALAHGRPTTLAASATIGKTGNLTLFVSADTFAKKLDFAGNMAIRGWHVSELYALLEAATKLQPPEGTLDLFAEWKARDGAISGGIKPVLKDARSVRRRTPSANKLKAWIADTGLHLFSDRVPGRNAGHRRPHRGPTGLQTFSSGPQSSASSAMPSWPVFPRAFPTCRPARPLKSKVPSNR